MDENATPADDGDLEATLALLKAQEAYKAAQRTGDAKKIAEAEQAWRELVRLDIIRQMG